VGGRRGNGGGGRTENLGWCNTPEHQLGPLTGTTCEERSISIKGKERKKEEEDERMMGETKVAKLMGSTPGEPTQIESRRGQEGNWQQEKSQKTPSLDGSPGVLQSISRLPREGNITKKSIFSCAYRRGHGKSGSGKKPTWQSNVEDGIRRGWGLTRCVGT